MTETTTIQITADQHAELKARKTYDDEPIKAVIGRLLETDDDGTAIDYAEIERRCERAIETTLEARR